MTPAPAVVLAEAPFSDIDGPELAAILALLLIGFMVAIAIVAAAVVGGVLLGRRAAGRSVSGRPPSAAVAVATAVAVVSALAFRIGPVWALVVALVLGVAISATVDRREQVSPPDEPDGPDAPDAPDGGTP